MLVLIASITHAAWNYLAKKTNGGLTFIWLIYTFSTIVFLPAVIYFSFREAYHLTTTLIIICFVSGGLRLVYFMALQTGYRKGDLSVVYPLARGSAPLLSTIGAITLMNEQPTTNTIAGLALIILGVIVITQGGAMHRDKKLTTGIAYGLLTGMIIAIYTLWDKLAITDYEISPLAITFSSHVLGAVLLAPKALQNIPEIRRELKSHYLHMIVISILSPVSYLLVLIAMRTTDVIYIAPAREVSILFGVLMGGQLMAEKNTGRRLVASAFILTGIILLAL
jgi:drug/metabolite transporter (DMT)-like permease